MAKVPVVFAILAIAVKQSAGACPHEEPGLTSFASLYPSLQKSDEVLITVPVLLNVAIVDVTRIKINGTGKLVFGRNISITVKTSSIMIEDKASFIIGSDDCRHEDNVHIILEGERSADKSQVGQAGEKFIALEGDGEIQIHGADRLSWTKLSATVDRAAAFARDNTLVKYMHSISDKVNYRPSLEGPAVYVFHSNATVKFYNVYDFYRPSDLAKEQSEVNKLKDLLDGVQTGELVALATNNFFKPSPSTSLSELLEKIENVTGIPQGNLLLRDLEEFDAFALVFVKGGGYAQVADKLISKLTTSALASLEFSGYKVSAASYIDPTSKSTSWVDFRILNPSIGYPVANVISNISSWNVGDEVMITSTDFEPSHTEVRKIKEVINSTSIRLSDELLYRHFGEIENQVDMRAEIGLLSRNIKIEGAMSRGCPQTNGNCDRIAMDTFGGHLKIMHTFGGAKIQGAELFHMGQTTQIGAYPIHFHMLKNITGKDALVQGNSIHHTFQRCVTVHGTFGTSVDHPGVVLRDNVAYDVFGHCFFLEDGAEPATILTGNLVANIKHIDNGFFTTDNDGVAGFWITNPKTIMIGNVAAGSEGFGIWYTFPNEPVGPSAGLVYAYEEALHTPLWTFDNNIAHSNLQGGLQFEKTVLDANGNVSSQTAYSPVSNPLNHSSDPVKVQITRLTAYKNKNWNVWARGGIEFMQPSSAESQVGFLLARGNGKFQQFVKKGVIIGQSTGNAEVEGYPDAITKKSLKYQFGVVFIYGPQHISDTWFNGFNSSADNTYVSGALSFKPTAPFPVSPLSSVYNLKFDYNDPTEGNRMFVGNKGDSASGFSNEDGNEISSIRDSDGSLTACDLTSGVKQVVKPEQFLLTDNCECRKTWQMCICSDLYGEALPGIKQLFPDQKAFPLEMQFERLSHTNSSDIAFEDHSGSLSLPRALVVLGDDRYYYQMQWVHGFPKKFDVEVRGVESGHDASIAICLPEGITKDNLTLSGKSGTNKVKDNDFVWAPSLSDFRLNKTMGYVYLGGRFLYMHFTSEETRDPYHDTARCLADICPDITVTLESEVPYTPCFTPTAAQLHTDNMLAEAPEQACTLAKSNREANWGVGDTTASHDGAWSHWGPWSECSGGSQQRTRLCDSPTKFGDGADCSGASSEAHDC